MMRVIYFFTLVFAVFYSPSLWAFTPIHLVAAENFYGEVAKELGGDTVKVISILQNPTQDPHLFTASPSIAKAVAEADIVVYNGANYDDWMGRLLGVPGQKKRLVLIVADLMGIKGGQNPHIWYMPATMSRYAETLCANFIALDPLHQAIYQQRLNAFLVKQQRLQEQVQSLKQKIAGLPVTATEPVFNWMAQALGLKMRNLEFQWNIENEASPSASSVKKLLDDLKNRSVHGLFFNTQVSSPLITQIKTVAMQNHIPVIGVTETQPLGVSYHQWMQQQLQAMAQVLLP